MIDRVVGKISAAKTPMPNRAATRDPVLVASATVAVIVHATVPGAWYVIAGALAGIVAAVLAAPRTKSTVAEEATP